jgi:hypothetical protein
MNYYQYIIPLSELPLLLQVASRVGAKWACCPYGWAGLGKWRLLSTAALGGSGEHEVSHNNALRIFESIRAAGGSRVSPGWASGPAPPMTRRRAE